MTKITTDDVLLWLLWNHQGGHSEVGQAVRKVLGMHQFERMTDEQVASAKHIAARLASTSPAPDGWVPTPMRERSWGGTEPEFRMDAYYYSFQPTGVLAIDLILSAVACAGKAFHHTESWNDDCDPYHERLRGTTPILWIENAAHDAAAAIKSAAPQPVVEKDHG